MATPNQYRRIIGYSYLLYILLITPVTLIHELGHAAICSANGYHFSIWLDYRGGDSLCYGTPENGLIMGAMGGIFGLITSFGILGFWYYFSKRLVSIAAVGLAIMLDQGLKMILEGFLPTLYSAGRFELFITISQIVSVAIFVIYLARKVRLEDDNNSCIYSTRESRLGI